MDYKSTKEEKFDSIYRSYSDDVFRLCMFFTKDNETAQDLAQLTFIKCYDHFEEVNPDCMHAYLVRTARNLFYNYQRDTKKEFKADTPAVEGQRGKMLTETLEEAYFGDKYRELQVQLSGNILEKMRKENEGWYKIFHMMYLDEKTYDEISEELGITKDV